MPSLYNCKHSGDQYRITKFTSDFEVEASYLCDLAACECPAGHRPKCRHREMLPKFIARNAVGTEWFFDHDRGGWVQGWKEEPTLDIQQYDASTDTINQLSEQELASEALPIQPLTEPSPEQERLVNEAIEKGQEGDYEYAIHDLLAPAGLGQASEQTPSPSPTIRRRV
jgi:hypothetical protein